MKVINACKPPPREMKKVLAFQLFLRNALATVQFTAWAKKSDACLIFVGKKTPKTSSFSEKRRTKQHIPIPGCWFRLRYHTRKLSTSTGFCALELQVRELGLNPVKVLQNLLHLRHGSVHLLRLRNHWLVAIHTAIHIIKIEMIFSLSKQRPNRY